MYALLWALEIGGDLNGESELTIPKLIMPIIVNLDVVMAQRKARLSIWAELVSIAAQKLSVLKI